MSRLIDLDDALKQVAMIAKALAKSDKQKALCGRIIYMLEHRPTVKAIPKDQYVARLQADMVAMLEQLDLEIQEQIAFMGDGEETNGMKRADNLIKDNINALKQSIWQDNYNGKKEIPKEVEQ